MHRSSAENTFRIRNDLHVSYLMPSPHPAAGGAAALSRGRASRPSRGDLGSSPSRKAMMPTLDDEVLTTPQATPTLTAARCRNSLYVIIFLKRLSKSRFPSQFCFSQPIHLRSHQRRHVFRPFPLLHPDVGTRSFVDACSDRRCDAHPDCSPQRPNTAIAILPDPALVPCGVSTSFSTDLCNVRR